MLFDANLSQFQEKVEMPLCLKPPSTFWTVSSSTWSDSAKRVMDVFEQLYAMVHGKFAFAARELV